ncbi:hypothetical protein NIES4075_59460 [Tolypothrix sp. NIES-4075]|uniref:hypothetical protein n=1 Tax=Tolypothrix sp. NIES-4075 TaxID=2005459 RepID=UPI000B5CAFB7|nr:hypothetical protein [Tolypothrix sp. NIES-4075]GAX44927.1 hypothetical protein NIES4075_59460 [Tolypothrix sp. NIES-4075]
MGNGESSAVRGFPSQRVAGVPPVVATAAALRRLALPLGQWAMGNGKGKRIITNSNSQFPIPNSQLPIPNSQFPIPQSPFSNYDLTYAYSSGGVKP